MRAIEIREPGGPDVLTLTNRDTPEPGFGDVRIRVRAAGVNRPDCLQRSGAYPPPPGASDLPGLEVSGVIDAVGDGVSEWSVGDAVCSLTPGGGYADYCLAPAGCLLPIPDGVSLEDAAGLPETYMTVWSNLFVRAYAKEGETVLVHGGSSGIGSTAIQLAKAFGLTVITTVGNEDKATFAKALGADHVINYRDADFVEVVKDVTHGQGVEIVLDMVGGDYIPRNIKALASDGRHVSIAFLRGGKVELNMAEVMVRRLTLTGSTLRPRDNAFKAAIVRDLLDMVWPGFASGALRIPIDSRFALEEAADAHVRMEEGGHKGKIILDVNS